MVEQQSKRLAASATTDHHRRAGSGDCLDLQSMAAHQGRHAFGAGRKLFGLAGAARRAYELIQRAQKLVG
jgi:hypothetical protein